MSALILEVPYKVLRDCDFRKIIFERDELVRACKLSFSRVSCEHLNATRVASREGSPAVGRREGGLGDIRDIATCYDKSRQVTIAARVAGGAIDTWTYY